MAEYKDVELLKKQIADFKRVVNSPNSDYLTGYISALSATEEIIAGLPDADVEPVKRGKWITINSVSRCSNCEYIPPYDRDIDDIFYSAYCPNCGAKMGGKEM